MKNIIKSLFFSFVTLTCFLFSSSCKDQNKLEPEAIKITNQEEIKSPSEIIEIEVAQSQYLTYEKRRVAIIQKYEDSIDALNKERQETTPEVNDPNGNRFDVARYVYWDYKTIKNYLAYIEKEAADANVEISTLRFYFSNYGPSEKNAVHPRQNSIMITPTLQQNNREYIFAIEDSEPENMKPLLLHDDFKPIINGQKESGNINKDREPKTYASFFSNPLTNKSTTAPTSFFAARSVTMNKGNSAPPPH